MIQSASFMIASFEAVPYDAQFFLRYTCQEFFSFMFSNYNLTDFQIFTCHVRMHFKSHSKTYKNTDGGNEI